MLIFIRPRMLDLLLPRTKLKKLTGRDMGPLLRVGVEHMSLLALRPNRTDPDLAVVLLLATRHFVLPYSPRSHLDPFSTD